MIKVISDEKKPIKIWASDLEIEAEMQLRNLANLPFIHSHVAVMPDAHAGRGSTVGTVIATRGAIIPAAVGVDIGCFIGETKIPLLNGFQKTLKELAESNEEFWVYSINENKNIVPGKAKALKTRSNADLMEIIVSGGDAIKCTPDHEFMLLDGSYKEAQNLQINDSLMPLYRNYESRDGYERIAHPSGMSQQTYKMVHEYFNGKIQSGYVVHHKDHTTYNNTPENLVLMTSSEHSKHHRNHSKSNHWQSDNFENKRKNAIKTKSKTPDGIEYFKHRGLKLVEYVENNKEEFKQAVKNNGIHGGKALTTYNKSDKGIAKSREKKSHKCVVCEIGYKSKNALEKHLRVRHVSYNSQNHKVISTKKLDYKEDVYCLQVEKYHNFALSAGVFVHNCGMAAVKLPLNASQMVDLPKLRHSIERSIPVGRFGNKEITEDMAIAWTNLGTNSMMLSDRPDTRVLNNAKLQLGSLGGGNHFIEVCLDEQNGVWVVLHSGSRNIGKCLAERHIDKAKGIMKDYFINLPDPDLAYLAQGTEEFKSYISDLKWGQQFAFANRTLMLKKAVGEVMYHVTGQKLYTAELEVNCHHNYTNWEHHNGVNVIVTRKGAVSAKEGELGIIPGSMGACTYIVKGLGNAESFHSCSHGAGRKMSRTKARNTFTREDLIKQTEGVECRKDSDIIDEIPESYKDIDVVMENQKDLVTPLYKLKQIICVKG